MPLCSSRFRAFRRRALCHRYRRAQALTRSVSVTDTGARITPSAARPSYCSGATYLALLMACRIWKNGGRSPSRRDVGGDSAPALAGWHGHLGPLECQRARHGRLFYELGLGRNFTDIREARPGDFLKVFWTDAVGQNERGHSVIYLGTEIVDGQEMVKYWSSNKPDGMGTRSVSRKKIAWMLFSRLEHRSESPPGRACRNPTPTSPRCYGWTPAAARRSSSRARRHRRLASRKNASYLFRMSRKIPVSAPQNRSSLPSPLSRWTACPRDRRSCRSPPRKKSIPSATASSSARKRPERGGKTVIVVSQLPTHLSPPELENLLKAARKSLACGGALNGREMELQGDQAARVRAFFEGKGLIVGGVS